MVKRMAVLAAAGLLVLLTGCSSSKDNKDQAAGATTTVAAAPEPGDGTFCGAYESLKTVGAGATMDNKGEISASVSSAAKQLRDTAPPEIADAANAYASLLDQAAADMQAAQSVQDLVDALAPATGATAVTVITPIVTFAKTACP